jgi:hypothetical protein
VNLKKKNFSTVKTININSILKDFNLDDYTLFVKLDVEGFEFNAIHGGLNIISKYHPIIIIELSKYIEKNKDFNFIYLRDFLKNYDYSIYSTNYKKITYLEVLDLLKDLDVKHKTIGNFYLLKNLSYNEKIFNNE